MSTRERQNLALSLASLLLAGNLSGFHSLSLEADSQTLARAIDIFAILRTHR